jgi:hypothetical protein
MNGFWHWLGYWTGVANEGGKGYGFFSGIGSVILVGGSVFSVPLVFWLKHNCHSHRCMRMGRHQVPGTSYLICSHHHKELHGIEGHLTFGHIKRAHAEAQS